MGNSKSFLGISTDLTSSDLIRLVVNVNDKNSGNETIVIDGVAIELETIVDFKTGPILVIAEANDGRVVRLSTVGGGDDKVYAAIL